MLQPEVMVYSGFDDVSQIGQAGNRAAIESPPQRDYIFNNEPHVSINDSQKLVCQK